MSSGIFFLLNNLKAFFGNEIVYIYDETEQRTILPLADNFTRFFFFHKHDVVS